MQRFVLDVESKFDYHQKALRRRDMDKIRLIVPLLDGKAKKWYETVHVNINRQAAARQGVEFNKDSAFRKWNTFFALLQASFGGSLTRDVSVVEWNRLRHQEGKIDAFLDRLIHLTYATGYSGDMVIDKIKEGLTDTMRRNWALVQNKPKDTSEYIAALRAFGHEIEQTDKSISNHNRSRGSGGGSENASKRRGKREKKERKDGPPAKPQTQTQPGPAKKGQAPFKDKDTELKGIPEHIREERRKASVCLKCGKNGHTWFKCFSKTPVTHSVNSASKNNKRKRKADNESQPEAKKAKVERVSKGKQVAPPAKSAKEEQPPSPRIFEIEDSDAMSIT